MQRESLQLLLGLKENVLSSDWRAGYNYLDFIFKVARYAKMLYLYSGFADLWIAEGISHMVCVLVLGVSLLVGYIYVLLCFSLLFLFFLLFLPLSSLLPFLCPVFFFSYNFATLKPYLHFLWSLNFCFSCIYVLLFYLISDHNFLFLFLTKIFIISFSSENFCVSLTAFISYCS